MMGLNLDPDDFPGTYTLFEAEARRRVWWDVLYYDLYVPGAATVILGVLTRERKVCVRFHGPSTVNSGQLFHHQATSGRGRESIHSPFDDCPAPFRLV